MKSQISVQSFQKLENDLSARVTEPKKDQNGELCAIIKVVTPITGFEWEPDGLGIFGAVNKTGEIWLYVPNGAKRITIKHMQLGILRNYFYPEPIEKGTVYEMKLSNTKANDETGDLPTQWLIVSSDPDGADLYLNDQPVGKTPYMRTMPLGRYVWRIQKELYINEAGIIELTNKEKGKIEVKMKGNFGNIFVQTAPEQNSKVSIDNIESGKFTPCLIERLPSGDHIFTVSNDMYETTKKTITIRAGMTDTLNIKMNPVFAEVLIKTEPVSDIYINGQFKGKGSITEKLSPGPYTFEAKLDKHNNAIEKKNIMVGQSVNITLTPSPRTGTINVISTPYDADIYIDGEFKGKTPDTYKNMLIGDYILEIKKQGYQPFKKVVSVNENVTMEVNEKLSQGTQNAVIENTPQNQNNTVIAKPVQNTKVKVNITTSPVGDIYIDGSYVGNNSWSGEIEAGSHIFEGKGANNSLALEKRNLMVGNPVNINLALSMKKTSLKVLTTPSGASISLDNKYSGQSPLLIQDLTIGEHRLKIEKNGFESIEKNISLLEGNANQISEFLNSGKEVSISSTPSGAQLWIDNKSFGTTPFNGSLDFGNHEIKLNGIDGYTEIVNQINVTSTNTTFSFNLEQNGKEFTINSTPTGANFKIGGVDYGQTPMTLTFNYGDYNFEFAKSGYKNLTQQVTLSPGTSSSLNYNLTKNVSSKNIKSFLTFAYQQDVFVSDAFTNSIINGDIYSKGGGNVGVNFNFLPFRLDVNGFYNAYEVPSLSINSSKLINHIGGEAALSLYLINLGKVLLVYAGGGYHFSGLTSDIFESTTTGNIYQMDTSSPIVKAGVMLNFNAVSLFAEACSSTTNLSQEPDIYQNYYMQLRFGLGIGF